tara:strand:+ start:54 stop:500 length:447 start_codon:yes stop_codon:yes gene_type:complete
MKKFLGILALGLFWCSSAYSDDIKIKRIECVYQTTKNKSKNIFFIISDDNKTAYMHRLSDLLDGSIPRSVKIKMSVNTDLYHITFRGIDSPNSYYEINRENGALGARHLNPARIVYRCSKMEDGFDPEKYFSEIVNKMIESKKRINIF